MITSCEKTAGIRLSFKINKPFFNTFSFAFWFLLFCCNRAFGVNILSLEHSQLIQLITWLSIRYTFLLFGMYMHNVSEAFVEGQTEWFYLKIYFISGCNHDKEILFAEWPNSNWWRGRRLSSGNDASEVQSSPESYHQQQYFDEIVREVIVANETTPE